MNSGSAQMREKENYHKYNKIDGILAVCVFAVSLCLSYFLGFTSMDQSIPYIEEQIISLFESIGFVSHFVNMCDWAAFIAQTFWGWTIPPLVIIIILVARKQKPASVGFRRHHNLCACLLGIAAGILTALVMISVLFLEGNHEIFSDLLKLKPSIVLPLLNVLLIGLPEELEFRAFLQSRITGLIHNRWVAILTVGLMFMSVHLLHRKYYPMSIGKMVSCLLIVVFHLWYLFVYRKTDNILAAAFCHGIYDYLIVNV